MGKEKKAAGAKTAVMRALEEAGVPYVVHAHAHKQVTAEGVAQDLGAPVAWVVKAMIVQCTDGRFALFVVQGDRRLSMKKATAALGDRGATLANERDVLRVTGYVVGSVSVAGFRRDDIAGYVDQGVLALEKVLISAGRPDAGIEISPQGLQQVVAHVTIGDYVEG